MPTVIDSLIVELGLDPKGFDEGRKKAAQDFLRTRDDAGRAAKDIEARGKQAAEFFGKLRGEALKLFTLFTAGQGLKSFVTDTIKAEVAVGQLSKQIGISTESLSAWQQVAKRNGGTADSITGALANLTNQFQQIQLTGFSEQAGVLWQLGIRPKDLNDAEGAILKIADALKKMPAERAAFFGRQLGFDPATIDLMRRGSAQLRKDLDDARRRGVMSDADVKAGRELTNELEDLKQASGAVGREILTNLEPAIITLTGKLRELAVSFRDVKGAANLNPETKSLIKDSGELGGAVGDLMHRLGELLEWFNKLGTGGGGPTFFQRMMQSLDHYVQAATHSVRALSAVLRGDFATAGREGTLAFVESQAAKGQDVSATDAQGRPVAGVRDRPDVAPAVKMSPEETYRALHPGSRAPLSADADAAVRTIIAEARAGDTVGQGDVAHVIMNRMVRTGKTAGQVVQQQGQFEPWMTAEGRARMARIDPNSKAYRDATDAWNKAYRERQAGIDPTGGATLFVSPRGQAAMGRGMPSWADPDRKTLERGGHQFYTGAFPGDRGARRAAGVQSGAHVAAPVTNITHQTNTTTIGRIEVNTQATDAKGVARDLRPAISKAGNLATQANSGIQ